MSDSEKGGYSRTNFDLPPGDDPSPDTAGGHVPSTKAATDSGEEYKPTPEEQKEIDLIQKAQEMYSQSTTYIEANITNQWAINLSHFHSRHEPGSAYLSKDFKRSKIFRPKTRAMVKRQEVRAAAAYFSTADFLTIKARDQRDVKQRVSAEINKALLQYRLEHSIPWFQTVMGAFQDTKNYGMCVNFNYWRYTKHLVPARDENGQIVTKKTGDSAVPMGKEEVTQDMPCSDNIPPENFRFDPMADWRDPVGSSPYLIYMMPIFLDDAMTMMETVNPRTGKPYWKRHGKAEILGTIRQTYNRTRQVREGINRVDPAEFQRGTDYVSVWAHMNIYREGGNDYVFWTMGTEIVLTEPELLLEAYPHLRPGERPFTMGNTTIETHRNYPAGDVEQVGQIQHAVNVISNQRIDNVRLALNKRYHVKRGSQVDFAALMRNVSGGGVLMNDVEKDVKVVETRDVTQSSYREQEQLTNEFDEIAGTFSQSAAQNAQGSSGTWHGMGDMSRDANSVGDYSLAIFTATWVEPTLRQLVRMEQFYESDATIIALAARESQSFRNYRMRVVNSDLLMQELTVKVDAGVGNTDPLMRVERLGLGLERVMTLLPSMAGRAKDTDIANEVFGALGYQSAFRFFRDDQEQAEYEQQNPPQPAFDQVKLETETKMRTEENHFRHDREIARLEVDREIKMMELALKENLTLEELKTRLEIAKRSDQTQRDQAAVKAMQADNEADLKLVSGV